MAAAEFNRPVTEVAYAQADKQTLVSLTAPSGEASVGEMIEQSGLLQQFPEVDLSRNRVGIFGQLVRLDRKVRDGDRIEIYRPLVIDPKEQRRQRAEG